MKRNILLTFVLFSFIGLWTASSIRAQDNILGQQNVITASVPFLIIGPDARAGGMGEIGVASSPDAYSQHWNAAKYMFVEDDLGIGISYSPWLNKLVNDISLMNLNIHYRFNERNAVSGGLRFFTLGMITFTNKNGTNIGHAKPNEFSLFSSYIRKFSENISGSIGFKFIRSDLTNGQNVGESTTRAGYSVASDVGFFYTKPLDISGLSSSHLDIGVNISNIGSKISYSDDDTKKNFIPTFLRIGHGLHMNIDEYNEFAFYSEIGKLLVPTPPLYAKDSTGQYIFDDNGMELIANGYSSDVSVATGMIQSFYDAPGGFREELTEYIWSLGLEYTYNKQFSIRGGYFNEAKNKGNRKFFTLGVGLKYNVLGIDVSYLIPTVQHHPLENTLRVSLSFNLADFSIGKEIKE
jgi:hypothetical protein